MFDNKRALHVVVLFSLIFCSQLFAVETEAIDKILEKESDGQMLDDYDRQAIAEFWAQGVEEMLITDDFDEIVEVKALLLAKKSQTIAGDYYDAYAAVAKENISSALDEIESWDNAELRLHLQTNLIILAAQIENPELVDIAFKNINSDNVLIRYWCLKALTSDIIVERLNSEIISDEAMADDILNAVKNVVENDSSGEVLELAINFLVKLNTNAAKAIIVKLVDTRIEAYESWDVTCELMDGKLLISLGNEILTETKAANKASITRKFAQLYSYVIQRYIIGKDMLSETQQLNLASVMVSVEKKMIGKLLEKPQGTIKRAIEKRSTSSLKREHDTLLGTSSLTGELARKIEYDYGKNPGGRAINAPKTLPNPPEPVESE